MSLTDSTDLSAGLEQVSITDTSEEIRPPTDQSSDQPDRPVTNEGEASAPGLAASDVLSNAAPPSDLVPPAPRPHSSNSDRSAASGSLHSSGRTSSKGDEKAVPVPKSTLAYMQQELCPRPPKKVEDAGLGSTTTVVANYYPMKFSGPIQTFCYNVEIVLNKRGADFEVRKREEAVVWFYAAVDQYKKVFDLNVRKELVYNDMNLLWTTKKLTMRTGSMSLNVQIPGGRTPKTGRVLITFTGILSIDPHRMQGNDAPRLTALIDCVMTQRVRNPTYCENRFLTHGRSIFFAPDDRNLNFLSVPVGHGLQAWTGLHGAIKPTCESGILYNCDISHSVFQRQKYSLTRFYAEIVCRCVFDESELKKYKDMFTRVGMSAANRRALENSLKGQNIHVIYANVNRSYKFGGVGMKAADAHEFTLETGRRTTVRRYFFEKFNLDLQCPYLPCIKLGSKNIWVPMEYCYTVVDPTKYRGPLPDSVKSVMIRKTAFPPLKRKEMIMALTSGSDRDSIPQHISETDEIMSNFGVSVEKEFISVKASLLPPPTLKYGNNDKVHDVDHHGVWEVAGKDLNRFRIAARPTVRPLVPGIVFIRPENPNYNTVPFYKLFDSIAKMGIPMGVGHPKVVAAYNPDRDGERLEQWMREYKANVAKDHGPDALPFILFVFPFKNGGKERSFGDYSYVKYVCDAKVGIYSQGIISKTYEQMMQGEQLTCSTIHNVAIKVMAKIGALHYYLERKGAHRNWTKVTDPEDSTLILGIDVSHADKEFRKSNGVQSLSIGCVVGNIDTDCMDFRPSVRVHRPGQEATLNIYDEVRERLTEFTQKTGGRPKHIVVYRDGVGESQFQQTLYEEKQAIDNVCSEMDADYKPTLTYIVMTKRHHTRFFPTREEDCEGLAKNLKPGTLIESGVTSTQYFDFFLQSQFGALGTSRPAHYYVLYDSWKPSNAFWQTITHCLTYSYVRCPRSISQPAPVMYAHLAAKKAKEYLLAFTGTSEEFKNNHLWVETYEFEVAARGAIQMHTELNGMLFT